jgi:hypothetical protein
MKLKISIWNALLLQGFAHVVVGATVDDVEKAMVCGLYFQGANFVAPFFAFFNSRMLRDSDFDNRQPAAQLALLKQHVVIAWSVGGTALNMTAWQALSTIVQRVDRALFSAPGNTDRITFGISHLNTITGNGLPLLSGTSKSNKQGAVSPDRIALGVLCLCPCYCDRSSST